MPAEISGILSFRPSTGGEPVCLAVAGDEKPPVGSAPSTQTLRATERCQITLELEGNAFAKSLVNHPAQVTVVADGTRIFRHLLMASAHGEAVQLGPLTLPNDGFADFIGTVSLMVTVENEYGVSAVGWSEPVYLQPAPSEDNRRLLEMLKAVKDSASLLTQPVGVPESEKTEAKGGESDVAEYFQLMERIVGAFARDIHYFEKSARFRLQQSTRLTALSRVENVTHRTLEFIATHPEELIETSNPAGILFRGRHYLPGRTLDEINKKSFDIYENRCLIGFLKTVLQTAQQLQETIDDLTADDAAEETAGLPRAAMLAPLQGLVAAYARCFDIEDAAPLAGLPQPSAIFISSMAYRPLYELMQAWFKLKPPAFESLRFYVSVAKSSRLYEYYVLLQLVKAMGEPQAKWRIDWPAMGGRVERDSICNVFHFQKEAAEVTIYYEPRLSSGMVEEVNDIGLVRTMVAELDSHGEFVKDPKGACYSPDFVIRVKEANRTRYWIADAKYATWPSAVRFYANDAIRKYLLQTSPRRPEDAIEGLTLFCGKKLVNEAGPKSLRNVDADVRRTPVMETFVLGGEEDADTVVQWLNEVVLAGAGQPTN